MKLTKKVEKEILEVYKAFWESLLNVNIRKFNTFLDKNFKQIGTTDAEVFFSKKEAAKFLKATEDQVVGNIELRNRRIKIEPFDRSVLVIEQSVAYVKIDNEWRFYAKTRATSLLQKKDGKWKFIQQHISFPDSRTQEGETIGLEKISKENLELRDAVKRRTIELEEKNQELEIESALERVRAVAMGMKQPRDMIEICRIISKQLQLLKIGNIRNVQTAIIDEKKGTYLNYEYFTRYKTSSVLEIVTKLHPKVQEFADTIKRSADAFFTTSFKGAALKKWIAYRKKTGQRPDPILDKAKSLHYYFYSIGPGALGLSTYAPLTDAEKEVFHRFRNVFDLAYRRFIDIEKAEAQAYEARIEASLERVRAQAMGIRKPEELAGVGEVIFSELKSLGFSDLRNSEIIINNDAKEMIRSYYYSDYGVTGIVDVYYKENPTVKRWITDLKKAKNAFAMVEILPAQMKAWRKYREEVGHKPDPLLNKAKTVFYYSYSIGLGALSISTWKKISDEQLKALERFKNVFGLAYRRYVDVANAEAQTREAQIEVAVERVRAKALAMHKSEEISNVVNTLRNELDGLKIPGVAAATITLQQENGNIRLWDITSVVELEDGFHFNMDIIFSLKNTKPNDWIRKIWDGKGKYFVYKQDKKSFKRTLAWTSKYNPEFADNARRFIETNKIKNAWHPVVPLSHGKLSLDLLQEPVAEVEPILTKMGAAFDLAYKRFLDLKNAEAQTREAQIEVALERVRARTMAMHKSDELAETSALLLRQFTNLGYAPHRMSIGIMQEEKRILELWTTGHEAEEHSRFFQVPLDEPHVISKAYNAWKGKKRSLVVSLSGKALKEYIKFWKQFGFSNDEETLPKQRCINFAFFSKGYLGFISEDPIPQQTLELLERFAGVFDLTYTRFLDLQKAEAQAREAQIEAALERVRSRTMAMHKTSELQEVIHTVHNELLNLNLSIEGGSFVVINDDVGPELRCWGSGGTANTSEEVQVPHFNMPFCTNLMKGIRSEPRFFTEEFSQKEKKEYFTKLFNHKPWSDLSSEQKKATLTSLGGYTRSVAVSKHTTIFIINHQGRRFTEAENDILKRFAKVFEQTYTRFLDLQKAEAQAREAQIELGLERVRARAMAMQKSDELSELVDTVFKELTKLDFALTWCIINIIDEGSLSNTVWAANPDIDKAPESYYMKFEDYPFHHAMMKGYKERRTRHVYVLEGEEKKIYDEYLFNETEFRRVPAAAQAASRAMERYVVTFSFSNFGGLQTVGDIPLSDASLDILSRFGKVFDLTYTRFNDLKQAEAQAREAQVEAALEKIRSRSLAMHHSKELKDVIAVLFEKLTELNVLLGTVAIQLFDHASMNSFLWVGNAIQDPQMVNMPYDKKMMQENGYVKDGWEAMREGRDIINKEYSLKEKNKFFKYVFANNDLTQIPEGAREVLRKIRRHIICLFTEKNSALFVDSFDGQFFSKENLAVIKRAGKVFEQCYIRFLDLQKAETQAREAQIEAALERVRAKTMAMHESSDLLNVVKVLGGQLELLHVRFDSVNFNTDYLEKDWNLWLYNSGIPMYPDKLHIPYLDHPCFNRPRDAYKEGVDLQTFVFTKEEKDSLFDHIYANSIARNAPEERKKYTYAAPGLVWSIAFTKHTSVTISNYRGEPFSEEENAILRRFANVFEQSYTRFLDLQKAEAQAREAQIQLALERVRARTMAMHHSAELTEVVKLLYQEFDKLKINNESTDIEIGLIDEETGIASVWAHFYLSDGTISTFKFPFTHFEEINNEFQQWKATPIGKRNELFFTTEFSTEQWDRFMKIAEELPELAEIFRPLMEAKISKWVTHNAYFSHGLLTLQGTEAYSAETQDIQKRFAKVFEQTYTRFLDLQKAEAQARESQIEAALERVRSRTMGMQKSDELKEVIQVVYEQFVHLNIKVEHSGFVVDYKERDDYDIWIADPLGVPSRVIVPYFDSVYYNRFNEAKAKGEDFFATNLSFEEKNRFYQKLFEYVPGLTEEAKEFYFSCPGLAASTVLLENVCLYIENFSGIPYTGEENNTLMRFGKVFQQTYTRFLDLQKAEAQTREAQIEVALERTRTHSMLMQHSNELDITSRVFHEQLLLLGIESEFSYVWLPDVEKNKHLFWATWSEGQNGSTILHSKSATYDLDRKEPYTAECFRAWESDEPVHIYPVAPAEVKNFFDLWSEIMGDAKKLKPEFFPGGLYYDEAFMKYGCFGIVIRRLLTEDEKKILLRFTIEFERTYTRFLDLQKAEAQAREAQIEAALERVRSRAMAMHKTDELLDAAELVYKELSALGITSMNVSYAFVDEQEKYGSYYSVNPVDGKTVPFPFVFPHTETNVMRSLLASWKKQEPFNMIELDEEATLKHQTWIGEHIQNLITKNKIDIPFSVEAFLEVSPKKAMIYNFNFAQGYIFIIGSTRLTSEQEQIVLRFTKVFELTYRRFLDLNQAEAQAREAKIETALERVRSRTMAMHKSEELSEAAFVLFQQFKELGEEPERIFIATFDEIHDGVIDLWGTNEGGKQLDKLFQVPADEPTMVSKIIAAWKEKKKSTVVDLRGEELARYLQFLKTAGVPFAEGVMSDRRVQTVACFSKGVIGITTHEPRPAESVELLERFAGVFNLTYTRFLDLQKAESQAREAQIELALERVRARTMAMHKSEELAETAQVMFHQLQELGGIPDQIAIGVVDEENGVVNYWSTDQSGTHIDKKIQARLNERTVLSKTYQAWKDKQRSLVVDLYGNDVKEWIKFAREEMGVVVKDEFIKDRRVHSFGFFSHGWILVTTHEPQSEETIQILERFASVFNLTYRRFLDLEKAEAQAKEAHIEAGLERVRARAMAMQTSEELKALIGNLFTELTKLDLILTRCVIMIYDPETLGATWWMANSEDPHNPTGLFVKNHEHAPHQAYLKAWRERKLKYVYVLENQVKKDWDDFLFVETGLSRLPDFVIAGMRAPDRVYLNASFNNFGSLTLATLEPLSDEHFDILLRFAKVFDLTYTRFNDLKQAEAQAKEARIEIALERIRARALAMHKSDELIEVAKVLWEQMALLRQPELEASVVHLYEEDPDNILSTRAVSIGTDSSTKLTYGQMAIPKNSCEVVKEWLEKFYGDLNEYTIEISGAKQKEWYDIMAKLAPEVVNSMRQKNSLNEKRYYRFSKFSGGALLMVSTQEPSLEVAYLQKRAAAVFDLAYRRFSDLQKAEAQAREAQIEAALERVRAKAMAMHKSEDLHEAVKIMFEEFQKLNLDVLRCGVGILNKDSRTGAVWATSVADDGPAIQISARESFETHPLMMLIYEYWQKQEDLEYVLQGQDLINYYRAMKESELKLPESQLNFSEEELQPQYYYAAMFRAGGLYAFRDKPFAAEDRKIMKRFASVVNLTYNRFLDLQKAEASAREAQIEAGLERVRSKAMAMHSSENLAETIGVFYRELKSLSVTPGRCGVSLMNKETRTIEMTTMNTTDEGDSLEITGKLKIAGHPILDEMYEHWLMQKEYHPVLRGGEIKEYYEFIRPQIVLPDYPNDTIQFGYYFMFKEGWVYTWTDKVLSESELDIYRRFTTVLSLTYKRYKDLIQAEANAREAQIEAGLERVRARTMAMHNSDDVSAATATMFTELEKLGIQNLRGGITIIKPDQTQEVWSITNLPDGSTIRSIGVFDMRLHPFWRAIFEAKERKDDYLYYWMAGKDKENYLAILNATPNYLDQPIKEIPDVHVQCYFFGEGGVWTNSLQPHSEVDKQIMKRFASVFSLTFRRYQDLKKAEAQAREATIEAALERVRGKAMAMHSSKDLATTIGVFYHELEGLNLTPRRCGVGLINKETRTAEISTMNATADGQSIESVGVLDMGSHPVLNNVYNNWLTKTEYHPVLRGNEIKEYYQVVRPHLELTDFPLDLVQYGYFFFFEEGGVYAWTEKELNEEELKIYRRFTSVLSLTYKRYKDLKDAEIRAQNAIKDAALDRIRADIASMRTINDLDRITPLIWNELTILGLPFIRCGVFIMDEDRQLIHTFLSTPDGKAIAAFHLAYDTPGNISKVIDNWRHKRKYLDHWGKEEFIQFADILMKQGTLTSPEQYLKTIPQGGFYLHFLPFLQGMLYVGNTEQLNDEQIELIQHVADAFSTAYARYEDFNKLEAAKQQVENALTDLKQAQQQLVQSEKMASLGELTAGIAHEIQNPLNFVNNFSDVSNELLEEMKHELEKGNKEDAIALVEDVKQNLEKILHHGRRADAIVKGMLQHSRASSGQKEMTDINVLADEYLRLAYHGLRAKDKSFNAKFETHFDNNIGKVNIIPQDIGRVILNLINNAFYTVTEKKKHASAGAAPNGYEPTVTVETLKNNGKIEIKVKDNGNGIPQKVLDKIFQPFFTTKPTGEGTGLGLSLAYDIITKGHGGELKVETKEGEGSEFIIQLPASL